MTQIGVTKQESSISHSMKGICHGNLQGGMLAAKWIACEQESLTDHGQGQLGPSFCCPINSSAMQHAMLHSLQSLGMLAILQVSRLDAAGIQFVEQSEE